MNQAYLSRIPLITLPRAYREGERYQVEPAFTEACRQLCPPTLAQQLIDDRALLQNTGLSALTPKQREHLEACYRPFAAHSVYAHELLEWLDGQYAFDPACLTD